jgi:hypothetical protein
MPLSIFWGRTADGLISISDALNKRFDLKLKSFCLERKHYRKRALIQNATLNGETRIPLFSQRG